MVDSRNGRRFALLFIGAAFLVLLLGRWLAPVNHAATSAAAPFVAVISAVANPVSDTVSGVFDGPRLRSEISALKVENGKLTKQVIADAMDRRDNALFKQMLHFQDDNSHFDLLRARYIGAAPNALDASIMINKGTRDDVHLGMTVLDQNGYLLGKISDAGPLYARVQLLLSPSSSVGVYVTRSHAAGLAEGRYNSRPVLDVVPVNDSLLPGDVIVTSGQYNLFPRGLYVGRVITVQHRNVALFQTAVIQPAADFNDLEIVQVVRNYTPAVPARYIPAP
ncbi:MAG: rod shape-determining protein MreC [Chloroflexota bacterium]